MTRWPGPMPPTRPARGARRNRSGSGFEAGIDGLRIARLGGWFARNLLPESDAAMDLVCAALRVQREAVLPEAERARGAAFLITMAEAAELHLPRLRARAGGFRPRGARPPDRGRHVARRLGASRAALPPLVRRARGRGVPRPRRAARPRHADVRAAKLGTQTVTLDGVELPLRANIGVHTQPISFIGLPVVAVPVWPPGAALPLAVQVIAPAWREDLALRVARVLEREGIARAPVAPFGA